jgi:hypothetical protein
MNRTSVIALEVLVLVLVVLVVVGLAGQALEDQESFPAVFPIEMPDGP